MVLGVGCSVLGEPNDYPASAGLVDAARGFTPARAMGAQSIMGCRSRIRVWVESIRSVHESRLRRGRYRERAIRNRPLSLSPTRPLMNVVRRDV